MKLYYSKGACSLAVRILVHELGIPCEFEAVNIAEKKTESGQDFLKINPKGAVPTVMLGNGEVLTENAVIQQYIADKHKATQLLPLIGDFNRYQVLEWMSYISSDLHKSFGPLFNAKVDASVKDQIFKPILINKLKFVDHHLSQNQYLLGDHYMLPDGYLFVILSWLPKIGIELSDMPNLKKYFENLKQRKSIQQSLKEEGLG